MLDTIWFSCVICHAKLLGLLLALLLAQTQAFLFQTMQNIHVHN
jgi:hypothetical protein